MIRIAMAPVKMAHGGDHARGLKTTKKAGHRCPAFTEIVSKKLPPPVARLYLTRIVSPDRLGGGKAPCLAPVAKRRVKGND